MSISFSMTGRDLVKRAMQDRRVLAIGDDPEAEEMEYGLQTLNMYLKSLSAQGVTPWMDVEGFAIFAPGVSEVTLTPRPADVMEARVIISSTYERPMTALDTGQYLEFPNKLQAGDPLCWTLNRTVSAVSMVVWPVPTVSRTIAYSYARVIEDASENNPVDLPQMWIEAIQKILAVKMTAFGDPANLGQLMQEAAILEQQLKDFDRPSSYIIGPSIA